MKLEVAVRAVLSVFLWGSLSNAAPAELGGRETMTEETAQSTVVRNSRPAATVVLLDQEGDRFIFLDASDLPDKDMTAVSVPDWDLLDDWHIFGPAGFRIIPAEAASRFGGPGHLDRHCL